MMSSSSRPDFCIKVFAIRLFNECLLPPTPTFFSDGAVDVEDNWKHKQDDIEILFLAEVVACNLFELHHKRRAHKLK